MNVRRLVAALVAVGVPVVTACGSGSPPPLQTSFEQVIRMDLPRIVEISTPDSIGSGVVSTTFQVTQTAGTAPLAARLVGVSPAHDLAVIRVTRDAGRLKPVTWADSAKAQVGDWVLAMAIQTSADINPGNSGGGLVDLEGHVLGIPTLELVDPQIGVAAAGLGFAIPSNTVVSVARHLIAANG